MVRDQDQDQCKAAETKTETETTKIGLETYSPDKNKESLFSMKHKYCSCSLPLNDIK